MSQSGFLDVSGGGGGNVQTLTGNSGGAVPPSGNNINILGTSGQIDVVGNPGTSTLTISLAGGGAAIDSLIPNSGTSPVVPNVSGEITIVGSGSVTTVGSLNTLTISSSGGGLSWSTIAGTTQSAAVDNGYVCGNAAQTTITLPSTFAVGARVAIEGLGAAGWILQAAGGDTIQIGSSVTSAGGTLTSAAATDNVWVTGIVANTTWRVQTTNSAGLTVA